MMASRSMNGRDFVKDMESRAGYQNAVNTGMAEYFKQNPISPAIIPQQNVDANKKGKSPRYSKQISKAVQNSVREVGSQNNSTSRSTEYVPSENEKLEEERLASSRAGDTWWTGPMNNTEMGLGLQGNINDQMGGKESNSLLHAQQSGNEALARKSQDIRGAAAQNSIMNGQLGQGMAQTGKMQAEMQTMQAMGDFQTNMAGLAAQEQQQAQQNALQALGLMQRDEEIAETKRQALISDDLSADKFRLDLINQAKDLKMPGYVSEGMQALSSESLSPEEHARALEQNEDYRKSEQTMQQVRTILNNVDPSSFNEQFEFDADSGKYTLISDPNNPIELDEAQSLEVSAALQNSPQAQYGNKIANRDIEGMTNEQISTLIESSDDRAKAGIMDSIRFVGDMNSFDSNESGGRPAAREKYDERYKDEIYFNQTTGIFYRLENASTSGEDESGNFKVSMSGTPLNGPNKGNVESKVWTSGPYDLSDARISPLTFSFFG